MAMHNVQSKYLAHSSDGTTAVARGETPTCPKHLPEEAKALWKKIVPKLTADGLLWSLDAYQLGNLCYNLAMLQRLQQDLWEEGPWHREGMKLVKNPLLRAVQDQQVTVNRLIGEYGLSVKARAALGDTMRSGNKQEPQEPSGVDRPNPRRRRLEAVS